MLKRTWRVATVQPYDGAHALALDGVVKTTPAGNPYVCPTPDLAAALAAEWNAAPQRFDPRAFPLSQLLATALDIVAPHHAAVAAEVAGYTANDLLCLRHVQPAALAQRQAEIWQPYLDWATARYGVRLRSATGLTPARQDAETLRVLHNLVMSYPPLPLTVLQQATALTGSLVLGAGSARWARGARSYSRRGGAGSALPDGTLGRRCRGAGAPRRYPRGINLIGALYRFGQAAARIIPF